MAPCCQEPDTSLDSISGGRNTERMPWAIHFRGNTEARFCIQVGSSLKTKKTPEMNCSTITTGLTIAVALRPERGTDENAMPSTVPAAVPRMKIHAKVAHRAASVGRVTSKTSRGESQEQRRLREAGQQHLPDLPEEVGQRRHRRAAQALERAVVAFERDRDGQRLEARQHDAGGQHARQEVLRERHTGSAVTSEHRVVVAAEHRGEDRQHDSGNAKMKMIASFSRKNDCDLQAGPRPHRHARPRHHAPIMRQVDVLQRGPKHLQARHLTGANRAARSVTTAVGASVTTSRRRRRLRSTRRWPRDRPGHRARSGGATSTSRPPADDARPGPRAARPPPGSGSSAGWSCRSARNAVIRLQNCRRASGSKPVVGSSRKSSSGSPMTPSATSSRRRWPPESARVRVRRCSSRPTQAMTSSASRGVGVEAGEVVDQLGHRQLGVVGAGLQHDPDP